MPSSKFAGKQTIKLPVICHKELYGLGEPYTFDEPVRLTVFTDWNQPSIGVDVSESFSLFAGPGSQEWTGWSSEEGTNLGVAADYDTGDDTWRFRLYLRNGLHVLDNIEWGPMKLPPRPPFDSGLLKTVDPPPSPQAQLRVLD